ncbi:very short patch repair endonuclease [Streptococcus milleri]|uniref:very short patch repair endonuclease n=1 Tax=Streptococcus milleri TaxID=33040 RepID=UPI000F706C77|nr:very short patch repair endonuclease [Streptococcus milleri]VEE80319.1 very short patch repair endonuclease [Streptococcus milleri]
MDNHTPEQRRKNMQAIKSKNSRIEVILRKELWSRGLRYQKNVKAILGKPDIVFKGKKIAIFCDGEFWHGFDWEHRKKGIQTRRDYWIPKIEKNMARDKEVTVKLEAEGWTVLRFWEKEIEDDVTKCADKIEMVLLNKIG